MSAGDSNLLLSPTRPGQDTLTFKLACMFLCTFSINKPVSTHLCAPKYFAPYPAGYEAADRRLQGISVQGNALRGTSLACQPIPCFQSWAANMVTWPWVPSGSPTVESDMAMGILWRAFSVRQRICKFQVSNQTCGLPILKRESKRTCIGLARYMICLGIHQHLRGGSPGGYLRS